MSAFSALVDNPAGSEAWAGDPSVQMVLRWTEVTGRDIPWRRSLVGGGGGIHLNVFEKWPQPSRHRPSERYVTLRSRSQACARVLEESGREGVPYCGLAPPRPIRVLGLEGDTGAIRRKTLRLSLAPEDQGDCGKGSHGAGNKRKHLRSTEG